MAQSTFTENVIAVLTQYKLSRKDKIETERITRHFPCNKNGKLYIKSNLDEQVKSGHTILLIEAGNFDIVERINYFYEQDKTTEFKVFGDILGYTEFKFDNYGNKESGISFVFKHATEWENAMGRRDITKAVNLYIVNLCREINEKINKKYVQEPIKYYNKDEIKVNTIPLKMFKYNYKNTTKEAFYIEGNIRENNTKVYCITFEDTSSSDDIVCCIEQMYKDPTVSSLFDKIIAYYPILGSGYKDEEKLYIIIKAK